MAQQKAFSSSQVFTILGLASLLFTVVLDYMLLPALSATLLEELQLSTEEFGWVASAYAISAGISAFLSSGYADRFPRKPFLVFFYSGFLIALVFCTQASSFEFLLGARLITGAFGGVIASICYAMVADTFSLEQRGRAMGWLQMAFATSLVLGLPLSMYLAAVFSWQSAYWLILGLGILALVLVLLGIPNPRVSDSIDLNPPWKHILGALQNNGYWQVFVANILIVGGDVTFTTFNAAYLANNLGLPDDQLPFIYGTIGITSLISAPLLGKLADSIGKFKVFLLGTMLTVLAVLVYTQFSEFSMSMIILLHILLFIGVNARMVSSVSLATAVPKENERGAFMALDSSIQQLAGGLAAVVAGLILFKSVEGEILYYPYLGLLIVAVMSASVFFVRNIERKIHFKSPKS
ncbi:MFS transporter [Algoriphagus sp. PAP.12]|uniref:MFS transporter n=1 Tax=Algoriphagus sp. PAP.12 TaxID=2996678 RepID=UPI00227C071C|nr:MFS transporter [Algoriphagus sp. PAP.12]